MTTSSTSTRWPVATSRCHAGATSSAPTRLVRRPVGPRSPWSATWPHVAQGGQRLGQHAGASQPRGRVPRQAAEGVLPPSTSRRRGRRDGHQQHGPAVAAAVGSGGGEHGRGEQGRQRADQARADRAPCRRATPSEPPRRRTRTRTAPAARPAPAWARRTGSRAASIDRQASHRAGPDRWQPTHVDGSTRSTSKGLTTAPWPTPHRPPAAGRAPVDQRPRCQAPVDQRPQPLAGPVDQGAPLAGLEPPR